MRNVLAEIQCGPRLGALPTLLLHGSADMLVPLPETRTALEKLRGSYFTERIYAEARHEVFNETNRAKVLDELDRFIARISKA